MQLNKNIKIFINYFFGPLLFLWLVFSISQQIVHQPQLKQSWQHIKHSLESYKIISLIAVVALMFVNWAIEALKWQWSVADIQRIGFLKSFKAILSGVSFSVTMPNRVGEYAGRMMYLPEGNRLKAVSVTLIGSASQLLITLLSGVAGLYFLKAHILAAALVTDVWYRFVFFSVLGVTIVLTLFYLGVARLGRLLEQWLKNSRWLYLFQSLKTFNIQLLLLLLLLSFLRYLVFVSQYFLLFNLFEVHVSAFTVWCVTSVVFLALAVIPSIALVEIGMRGKVSLQLMGLFTTNGLGVVLTSVTIWFINLIVPALAGSILILSIKVFKRKNETTI